MLEFSVGDLAVYQDQGIGKITGVDKIEVGGHVLEVYSLLMESGATVRVPTHKAKVVGMRNLTARDDLTAVYDILRSEAEQPKEKAWNRRYRAYNERLRSGHLTDVAKVMRDLAHLRHEKEELSFGERQMLEQARDLIVREIALSAGREDAEVADEVDALFRRPARET
jgi:CarD family transcriptional regulator